MSKHRHDDRARRARQHMAMARPELRLLTQPRRPAQGATSYPLKRVDAQLQQLLDEARGKAVQR